MTQPLSDHRVIDLTRLLPGSFATMLLARLGAQVIRVEPPASADPLLEIEQRMGGDGSFVALLNAGKQRLALDVGDVDGRELLGRLLDRADVLVESYRPGAAGAHRLDFATLASEHPRLVVCSLTASGLEGGLAERGGHDLNLLAMAGVLAQLHDPDSAPIVPGIQVAGIGASALPAVQAVLAALVERASTGRGRHAVVSIVHNLQSWLGLERSLATGRTAPRGRVPCYGVYETADGRYATVGAAQRKLWESFCAFAGRSDWVERQFDESLVPEVQEFIGARSWQAWCELAARDRVPVEPVTNADEAYDRVAGAGAAAPGVELLPGVWFSGEAEPGAAERPSPALGADTDTILDALGLGDARIDALRERGVV